MSKEEWIFIVSVLTVIASYSVKLVGFPRQIQKIREKKSTEGLSKSIFITSFLSFILWVFYGVLINDWTIILGQGLGVIVGGITLYYIWKYREKDD